MLNGSYFKENMIFNAQNGPSRYIFKNLAHVQSLKALALAFEAEEHRFMLSPLPLDLAKFNKVLVLAPHTDDEVIGCGGLLLQCRKKNIPAEVYFTTDSCNNEQQKTEMRLAECKQVMTSLDVPYSFSSLSNIYFETYNEHIDELAQKLRDEKNDAIFYPWLFDQPIKHRYTNLVLYLTLLKYPELQQKQYYGYQVHNTILVNSYLDITDEIAEKYDLINLYQSQVSSIDYAEFTKAKNLLNSKFVRHISKPRYFEVFHGTDGAEIVHWVKHYYLTDLESLFRGDKMLINQAQKVLKLCLPN